MGYGFLEFENKDQVKHALETLNGKPLPKTNDKKTFKLNYAVYNANKTSSQNPNEFSIYVCELDPSVTEEVLNNFFKEKYKSVINSKIIVDPSTKISKGYGFVKFSDKTESEKAISEMNGKQLNGKAMKTGTASYKKNDKKPGNMFNDLSSLQNDPSVFLQQQPYLNQFYLANGYYHNYMNPYLLYTQLLTQALNNNNPAAQQPGMNLGGLQNNDLNMNAPPQSGDQMMMNNNISQQYQGQDLSQLFGNLGLLQNNAGGQVGNMGQPNNQNQDEN